MEPWKARVERVQRRTFVSISIKERDGEFHGMGLDIRKNIYCSTMGCCARRPKLLTFPLSSTQLAAGTDCFSMRAHVR